MKEETSGSGKSGSAGWAWKIGGISAGAIAAPFVLQLLLLYYTGRWRTEALDTATNLGMLILLGGSLGWVGFDAGRRLAARPIGPAGLPFLRLCGATIGGEFGGIVGWLSAPGVQAYLASRILVDQDGFKSIQATMPFFVLLFTFVLVVIFALNGLRFVDICLRKEDSDPRSRLLLRFSTRLTIGLIAAFVGIEFGFEFGTRIAISVFDIFPPLVNAGADLRWFYFLAQATMASLCALPVALAAYALARWPRFALALIGLRLGMHIGELSALRVYDFYNGRVNSFDELLERYANGRLVLGFLWGALLAIAGYWSARSLTVACAAAAAIVAAALGVWIAIEIQAFYYNDLEWRVLEEVLFFLFGGLGALAGCALGRWISELRTGARALPAARDWTALLSGSLLRIAMAGVGLWLGAEVGYWVALLWDEYIIAAPFAYDEIALVWIGSGCAVGGALAILGYRYGHRAPIVAAFLGAVLAFALGPSWVPMHEHLYWGPFPSSDVDAELWQRSLLVTVALVTALSLLGAVGASWLHGRPGAKEV